MIDAHCHLDQIDSPEAIAKEAEARSITVVAVTNLPSHYAMSLAPLRGFKFVKPALGYHPLMVAANPQEMMPFIRLARAAEFIGEVGLDFSQAGVASKEAQVAAFEKILDAIQPRHRFVTIHSRGAVEVVLEMLTRKVVGPVVFHWFSGSLAQLKRVLAAGHYFSVNPAMIRSQNGARIIAALPPERVLTETDAPFTNADGRKTVPWDVGTVIQHLANEWGHEPATAEKLVEENFQRLLRRGL